jgi:hypothetical protein
MGQVLHGCARTTAAVRRAIQHSQKSLNGLAETVRDQPEGCRQVEEAGLCQPAAGRLLICLAAEHPASDAFIFARCLQRHGISRLPEVEGDKANGFLDNLIKAVPYKIHTVFTDNGIQFPKREGTEAYWTIPFDRLCDALGIEHRLTKINHPWTNGQVERITGRKALLLSVA